VEALSLNLLEGKQAPFLWQGGGLYILGSSTEVMLANCNIYSNKAIGVSTRFKPRARC
jgi:hypothetical protein